MSWSTALIIYVVVFAAIVLAAKISLRTEPTAHGKAIGTGCAVAIGAVWPVALPYFVVVGILFGLRKLFGQGDGA